MKLKRTVFLATFVVTLGLLLGASAAQAANVKWDPNNPTQAIRIENLVIDDELYTVAFTDKETVAADIYDAFPGTFDFEFNPAKDAADAVNEALRGMRTVGAAGSEGTSYYRIGAGSKEVETPGQNVEAVLFWESDRGVDPTWTTMRTPNVDSYNNGEAMWADFTLEGPAPDPVTIGGTATGLEGRGLVLRNGGDFEPITANGGFTFRTPMTPGDYYNVTVPSQPTDPAQTCSVENGSGPVPSTNVTDVEVTCAEPVFKEVNKVAAEGDTLPDGTVLWDTYTSAGVAINLEGLVAFVGRDDEGTNAVFTQDKKVAAEGDTIGGTGLKTILTQGGVAINLDGLMAFHGDAFDPDAGAGSVAAVFTQDRVIVRVGDTVPDGTVDQILETGNVAINNLNQVAFHGTVEIGEGPETVLAVFTGSDGQDTQVVALMGSALPDGTTVVEIMQLGSVAINDFNVVAFHGLVDDPVIPGNRVRAVFTTERMVAFVGDILEDGTTLQEINEQGGVAINFFGDVAFHGGVKNQSGVRVSAVITQDGVVAKVGDLLPDGSRIEEINGFGGVAINIWGDVVFLGRTDGVKAVFTQNGVVAKVGDNLADGTTLKEITDTGYGGNSVVINPYGTEVVFQGQIDNQDGTPVDAVFVGQAP
jgi:hypothetical protein